MFCRWRFPHGATNGTRESHQGQPTGVAKGKRSVLGVSNRGKTTKSPTNEVSTTTPEAALQEAHGKNSWDW
ncbi:hypothetical protein BDV33DRAFT_71748 [Aspergillus novoparasiticus]|uniref:Uncharacterized protein n=1 Tax=Aspergillus novoparasiticus TaxID=986946 RepID=A0A5N6EWA0_9EURO|nr:hypothetical protein BDV33DRAFT_71748 [Aspergillus novoparasiticus]